MPASDRSSPETAPTATNSASSQPDDTADRLSDKALEALRNRDPQAVQQYVYGNKDFLQGVLRRYTETEETAQDLLQETFFQALRSLPDFRGESKITTWLYSIAKNVALARYRKDKRRSPLEEETLTHVAARDGKKASGGPFTSWNPIEETTRNEEATLIREALDELSENYREVIELRDLQELSTKEVAEQLGLTRVNVRVRLHRARQKLAEGLNGRFDPEYQMNG